MPVTPVERPSPFRIIYKNYFIFDTEIENIAASKNTRLLFN